MYSCLITFLKFVKWSSPLLFRDKFYKVLALYCYGVDKVWWRASYVFSLPRASHQKFVIWFFSASLTFFQKKSVNLAINVDYRVRTSWECQNSMAFPGLFKDKTNNFKGNPVKGKYFLLQEPKNYKKILKKSLNLLLWVTSPWWLNIHDTLFS